jgi:acyl-CoA synthetase (AMP-forming)/AMP-acid ligase II
MAVSSPLAHGKPVPQAFTTGPRQQPPFTTVTAAIRHWVRTCPSFTAAVDLSQHPGAVREITYSRLDKQARNLAQRLRVLGVKRDDRVPLVVKRGIEMLVGIYAILLCGAQYVPLDGGVVVDQTLEQVLAQSGGRLAVVSEATKHRFEAAQSDLLQACVLVVVEREVRGTLPDCDPFQDLATPETGCYAVYTSGILALVFT